MISNAVNELNFEKSRDEMAMVMGDVNVLELGPYKIKAYFYKSYGHRTSRAFLWLDGLLKRNRSNIRKKAMPTETQDPPADRRTGRRC